MKIIVVAGARPNFMKVAPLMNALEERNSRNGSGIVAKLVHTGQHYDEAMSGIFFRELGIRPPDINLGTGAGSHAHQTASIMTAFETVCNDERPDWVVVVGDVNSTMACTLVCSKMGINVAHVEAGLRSFDRSMPEEINRIVTDAIANLLLTPSADADENLRREGASANKIVCVGNIMIDALVRNLPAARQSRLLESIGLGPEKFAYVTLHRPSNVDGEQSLRGVMQELGQLSQTMPVVFPMHPRTRKMCSQFGIPLEAGPGLTVLDPIGYHDSLHLTENARLIVTDSGGLQEESTFFRTPCLTLRENTERPITIRTGSNRLTSVGALSKDIDEVLRCEPRIGNAPPLWDGHAARRIVEAITAYPRV